MLNAEEYQTVTRDISGAAVKITTYRIGNQYHCHVANADPGATIARAEAATRDEAVSAALAKAQERLK